MSKIISVYFNGTDDEDTVPDYGCITLAALLHQMTVTDDLHNFSICVNGCGIETRDFRDLGGIFTFHLEKQVLKIANLVEGMVKSSVDEIILNIYGFSRGGAAAFWLCQKLKHIPIDRLKINVVSCEPVPGNFVTVVYGDLLLGINSTLSSAVSNLTPCQNISNMLVLFTNEPLPDIACHAPILPALPSSCNTEIDVTPGCHKNAVAFYKRGTLIESRNDESAIVFHRVVEFMQKSGTKFNFNSFDFDTDLIFSKEIKLDDKNKDKLLRLYEGVVRRRELCYGEQKRSMHFNNTIFTTSETKKYLNHYHQKLSNENINDKNCVFTLHNRNPVPMNHQYHQAIRITQLMLLLAVTLMIYNKFSKESNLGDENQFRPNF